MIVLSEKKVLERNKPSDNLTVQLKNDLHVDTSFFVGETNHLQKMEILILMGDKSDVSKEYLVSKSSITPITSTRASQDCFFRKKETDMLYYKII